DDSRDRHAGRRSQVWLVALWRYPVRLVSPDHVGSLGAVGNDLDDAVMVARAKFVGDAVVEGCGVGEVERHEGEVARGDELGENTQVAGAGHAGGAGR